VRFTEVGRGLTGFSTPILGISWDPGTAEVSVTRRALVYLVEDSIDLKGDVVGILHASDEGPDDEPDIDPRRRWR
jgi:hypothetical protein